MVRVQQMLKLPVHIVLIPRPLESLLHGKRVAKEVCLENYLVDTLLWLVLGVKENRNMILFLESWESFNSSFKFS